MELYSYSKSPENVHEPILMELYSYSKSPENVHEPILMELYTVTVNHLRMYMNQY